MHFGKKQSNDPIEERLDKVESILPYLVRRDEHESLAKGCALHEAQSDNLERSIKVVADVAGRANENGTKLSELLLGHVTHWAKVKDNLYEGIDLCQAENAILKSALNDFQKVMVKNGEMHDISQRQIKTLEKMIKEDRERIKYLEDKILKICDEGARVGAELKGQSSAIQDLRGFIPTLREDNRNIKKKLNENVVEIVKNYNKHKEQLDDVIQTFNNQLIKIKKETQDKVGELTEIVIPSETEILSKVDSKMESLSMDAKNACLRSSNTEAKLVLMDKKIENIKLLLQRHELNK